MKKILLVLLCIVLAETAFTQETIIDLSRAGSNSFDLRRIRRSIDIIEVNTSLSYVSSNLESTESGNFVTLESDGLVKTYDLGKPNIPVFSRLIEIPLGATVRFKVLGYEEEIIHLAEHGITEKVIPAQPSVSKTPVDEGFYYDEGIYNEDRYFNTNITDFEDVGILRSVRLGRIVINPIQYNPVQNKLRVLNNLRVEVEFVGSNHAKTQELKAKYENSLFNDVIETYTHGSTIKKRVESRAPITYAIVADRMFESTLEPFISHKEKLGYKVIVGYTDQPTVGTDTVSIKNYLENLYKNPQSGYSAPTYALLVGDHEQVPSYEADNGRHLSDMYYFDYTQDKRPDVFYGRFSAKTVGQLKPQIDKTLMYEKGLTNLSYVYDAVFVAGDDDKHELKWGNGHINYATSMYFNESNGITAHTYLQNEPLGGDYAKKAKDNISAGVGYVSYTAHCNPGGWSDPRFSTSEIKALTNKDKYGLWVGNCCRSNRFSVDECFGEAAVRTPEKGAVGYIGATDYTYWDEDYWWAVGAKSVVANPVYDADKLGAYDRLFSGSHLTQAQFMTAGNLAIDESESYSKLYYWEIYHLMGDPSLKIRFVSTDCVADTTITENITGGVHDILASNSITASNVISGNATVHYGANKRVVLLPGFKVGVGSSFRADMNGCRGTRLQKSVLANIETVDYIQSTMEIDSKKNLDAAEIDRAQSSIRVYPNPAPNGQFTIEMLDLNSTPKNVVIYNSLGARLYENCNPDPILEVSGITAKGVVLIKVNFNDKSVVKRMVLK